MTYNRGYQTQPNTATYHYDAPPPFSEYDRYPVMAQQTPFQNPQYQNMPAPLPSMPSQAFPRDNKDDLRVMKQYGSERDMRQQYDSERNVGQSYSSQYDPRDDRNARLEDDGIPEGSIYAQNKARFDNPLAHNDAWTPTQEDYNLRQLPKIDLALRVKARLSRTAGKPFEPEPRSFQRAPRLSSSAGHAFQPVVLQSNGKTGLIGAGFKPNYFGPLMTAHDISAADFGRFLEDIFTAGKVGGVGQVVANVAPFTMHMGVTGYFVTKAIVKGMARRNEPLVVETIETWQDKFFGPRGLSVYAVSKRERVTAKHVGLTPEPLSPEIEALAAAATRSKKEKRGKTEKRERKERKRKEKKDRKRKDKSDSDSDSDSDSKDERKIKDKNNVPFLVIEPLGAASSSQYGVYGAYGRYGEV